MENISEKIQQTIQKSLEDNKVYSVKKCASMLILNIAAAVTKARANKSVASETVTSIVE